MPKISGFEKIQNDFFIKFTLSIDDADINMFTVFKTVVNELPLLFKVTEFETLNGLSQVYVKATHVSEIRNARQLVVDSDMINAPTSVSNVRFDYYLNRIKASDILGSSLSILEP